MADQVGQSRTRLNVLHADAVQRHYRPSGDQLAKIEYHYYYSPSASIITLSNLTLAIFKVLLSTPPTYPWPGYVWSSYLCTMLRCRTPDVAALETLGRL